jgi:hypothetical protein
MSFLSTLGKDIKAVFAWIGSPAGQTVIATGEGLVTAIDPGAQGIVTLANAWMQEIIKTEALAAAAGVQNGSGTQKAAAVIASISPEVLAFAQVNKLPAPTAAQIQTASNALVAFLNAFGASTVAAAPTA